MLRVKQTNDGNAFLLTVMNVSKRRVTKRQQVTGHAANRRGLQVVEPVVTMFLEDYASLYDAQRGNHGKHPQTVQQFP